MQEEGVVEAPWRLQLACAQTTQHVLRIRGLGCRAANVVDESEGWAGADAHGAQSDCVL
jgi:hypothetical protein